MKMIIFTRPDGGLSILRPAEGARLARQVTLADGTVLNGKARPVDRFLRRWPVAGATADWAETEDEFVSRIMTKDVPAGAINPRAVLETDIPADRTFRDAWGDTGAKIVSNLIKAQGIGRSKIRESRGPRFLFWDGEYAKAQDASDTLTLQTIAAKRTQLRNAPQDPRIAAAATPADLKTAILAVISELP